MAFLAILVLFVGSLILRDPQKGPKIAKMAVLLKFWHLCQNFYKTESFELANPFWGFLAPLGVPYMGPLKAQKGPKMGQFHENFGNFAKVFMKLKVLS